MKPVSVREMQKQVAVLEIAERIFDPAVLFALFELGVFAALSTGKKDLNQLADEIRGDWESLRATLDAAVALKILSRDGAGSYSAHEDLLDCLGRPGSPAFMGEWIAFLHALAGPLLQLHEAVRTGTPPAPLFELTEDISTRMTRAMDAYARSRGVELVRFVDLSRARSLLDLGCGPGTYSMAIKEARPDIEITLFDLPETLAETRKIAAERGIEDRFGFVGGDALEAELGGPFDVVLISNILHLFGPDVSRRLLRRCFDALNPSGTVVVQAQFLAEDRVSARWPALINLSQRVISKAGVNHTVGETVGWLQEAGFSDVHHVPFSLWNVCSAVVGTRP